MGLFWYARFREMEDVFMSEMIAAVMFIVIAVAAGVWVWWLER